MVLMRIPKRFPKSWTSGNMGTTSARSMGDCPSSACSGWRARKFAIAPRKKVTVALNRFAADTDEEIAVVADFVRSQGGRFAESRHFSDGGPGSADLAREVMASVEENSALKHLYDLEDSFHDKVRKVAKAAYGADDVIFTKECEKDLKAIASAGLGDLPICIAKTPASLTDDPTVLGRPEGFNITARNVQVSAGAGFLVVLTGNILRMPGLPKSPQAYKVRLNADGTVDGVA